MRSVKAQLHDGTQVSILEVVNQNKPLKEWRVKVIDENKSTFIIDITHIKTLGGT